MQMQLSEAWRLVGPARPGFCSAPPKDKFGIGEGSCWLSVCLLVTNGRQSEVRAQFLVA
jgi:hypothetical protein